jgi:hypothetical protein
MRIKRLNKLLHSSDEAVRSVVAKPWFAGRVRACAKKMTISGYTITSENELKSITSQGLHSSIDGRGLRWNNGVPAVNRWVTDGTRLLTGADFISAIKVRGNLLPTRMRCSRGTSRAGPIYCSAGCNALETLSHISQSCARTHRLRTTRHDSVLKFLEDACNRGNIDSAREPCIPLESGSYLKPDLLFKIGDAAYVTDVTITADHVHPLGAFNNKVEYYNKYEVRQWARTRFKCEKVFFSAFVLTWRGAVLKESSDLMLKMNIPLQKQIFPVVRVLTYTAYLFKHYTKSTTRGTGNT